MALEAGAEAVGTAFDLSGILAPLGAILQVGAAVWGGYETAKSITDASSATTDEDAQNKIAEQKTALQKTIANQQFVGANVTPDLSSVTSGAVTAGAF